MEAFRALGEGVRPVLALGDKRASEACCGLLVPAGWANSTIFNVLIVLNVVLASGLGCHLLAGFFFHLALSPCCDPRSSLHIR